MNTLVALYRILLSTDWRYPDSYRDVAVLWRRIHIAYGEAKVPLP